MASVASVQSHLTQQQLRQRTCGGCGHVCGRLRKDSFTVSVRLFSRNGRDRMSSTPLCVTRMPKIRHGRAEAVVAVAAAATTATDQETKNVGDDAKNATTLRISETFTQLKKEGKVAFIPYVAAGDPDLETTGAAVKLLDKCGADIIELGVPYSDPLADGPVIQAAASRGIRGGTTLDSVLNLMRDEFSQVKAPIVVFLYYNPLLKRGVERFLKEAKAAGAAGLVVPDLPLEETGRLRKLTVLAGMELVLLTTPTTPRSRMTAITEATQGFTYLVSLTGVTGARKNIESRVEGLLKDIKQATRKPVAVGFGVSTPQQASKLADWGADGVIIGSAIVKLLGESESAEEGLRKVEEFSMAVRDALSARCDVPPNCPLVCGVE